MTKQELFFFIHEKTLNEEALRAYLHGLGVRIMPYEAVYQIASAFRYERVLLESRRSITSVPVPGCECESDRGDEPDGSGKSSQNPVEQENMRRVHVQMVWY